MLWYVHPNLNLKFIGALSKPVTPSAQQNYRGSYMQLKISTTVMHNSDEEGSVLSQIYKVSYICHSRFMNYHTWLAIKELPKDEKS